jgi:hypothetical protein
MMTTMPVHADQVDHILETFAAATEENQLDSFRDQQTINLPAEGELWVAGDIHDHRSNFRKFIAAADLGNNPHRHVILQELIHGDHYDSKGREGSWAMLHQSAELKCDFPQQVHFLFANHDLAQIHGEGIMKAGLSVCEAFTGGVRRDFGERTSSVNVAITEYLLSLPLAARTQNGLFFCHSMPTDDQMDDFDYSIFDRPLTGDDYARRKGPAYKLIWGRHITPDAVEKFRAKVGADIIITGHQPQEAGFLVNGEHHLILASDHNQGVFLPIDLAKKYTMEELVECLMKFVALDV